MIDQIMNVVNMFTAHNASELQFYRELLRIYQVLICNLLSKYKKNPLISLSSVLYEFKIAFKWHKILITAKAHIRLKFKHFSNLPW